MELVDTYKKIQVFRQNGVIINKRSIDKYVAHLPLDGGGTYTVKRDHLDDILSLIDAITRKPK